MLVPSILCIDGTGEFKYPIQDVNVYPVEGSFLPEKDNSEYKARQYFSHKYMANVK